jgi:cysteine synthase
MESILEAIGNTPLIRVHRRTAPSSGSSSSYGTPRARPGAVIVTFAVDTGFKYLSVSPYGDE